ncbi:hypothetical protein [Pannonibacter tanglangensis]|uniref:Uncharacterized protein n=1 Tax=Pannonibacter tanglangensis TaxID=2750084 RepID=A0ABW9ZGH6_9HYPH|nr:hypothetical protein [Pannonibacter sp. XCT-34]NBN62751.1 hypothetical protein [Pannonibacter sp. XCT-34]
MSDRRSGKRLLNEALSSLLDVLQKGDRVYLIAELTPEKMDAVLAEMAANDDFEDDDPLEANGDERSPNESWA